MNVFFQGYVPIDVHQNVGARYECENLSFSNPLSNGDEIEYTMLDGEKIFLGRVSEITHNGDSSVVFTSRVAPEGKGIYDLDELLVRYMKRTSSNFQQIL